MIYDDAMRGAQIECRQVRALCTNHECSVVESLESSIKTNTRMNSCVSDGFMIQETV